MAVRREAVRLELEDAFTRDMLAAAQATKLLERNLKGLDGTAVGASDSVDSTTRSTKQLTREQAIVEERTRRATKSLREEAKAAVDAEQGLDKAAEAAKKAATANDVNSRSIDRYSGRLGLLLKTAAVLGPTIAPIGTVAVAGLAAISAQAGFAATGLGAMIVAFQGVGDALSKVNKAVIDPTAKNIQAAHLAMAQLGPDAREFVKRMAELRPVLHDLRDSAASGLFPGMIEALDSLESAAPRLEGVLNGIAQAAGDALSDGAQSLAGPRWFEFINFVGREAPPALAAMSQAVGSLTHGLAGLWMAFDPVNDDFLGWLTRSTAAFDAWANGLSRTQGFQEFVGYMRENGPKVADAFVAMSNAILQIVEAAAPLGGPTLDAITAISNAIATIADSPLGTPIMAGVTALSALSLAATFGTAAVGRLEAAMVALGISSRIAATEATAAATAAATASGASGAAAAGAGRKSTAFIAGGPAGIAAAIGLTNLSDEWENVRYVFDGERSIPEGLARLAAATTPTGQALGLLGVNISGIKEPFLEGAIAAGKLNAQLTDTEPAATKATGAMFAAQRRMLKLDHQADGLRKTIREQNKAASEAADSWTDFSQKVKVNAGPGIETVIRRMERLGEAAANEAENIQTLLKRGVDPEAIQRLYDMLGGPGAAVALQDLVDGGKGVKKAFEDAFGVMVDGRHKVKDALTDVAEEATHVRKELDKTNRQQVTPDADLDTQDFDRKGKRIRSDIDEFSAMNAIPTATLNDRDFKRHLRGVDADLKHVNATVAEATADLDNGPLRGGVASAERLLTGLTRPRSITISIHTVRVPGDTAGGPVAGQGFASGGYTGDGRKFEPAGIVHRGEVVLPQDIVQRDRAMLWSRYGHLPGMSEGGMAGARGSERPVGSGGGGVVRHVFEHRVIVRGELDAKKAVSQFRAEMHAVSQDAYDQNRTWEESQSDG